MYKRMLNKIICRKFLWLVILIVTIFPATMHASTMIPGSFVPPASAQALTRVYVDPQLTEGLVPGDVFAVNIMIEAVMDLKSWQFQMSFSGLIDGVLSVTDVIEGDFLMIGGTTYFTWNTNNAAGLVRAAATILGQVGGVYGDGWLATVIFEVVGGGESPLDLHDTILLDSTSAGIPHDVADGYFIGSAPQAVFTYSPLAPSVGVTVVFDASLSYDADGTIATYIWNFGDTTYSAEADPITTHAYAIADTYLVTLTVTDNDGFTDNATALITVTTEPPPSPLTSIYIAPSSVTTIPHEFFTVDIRIANATNVFAWEIKLGWEARLLDFVSVEEGDFLKGIEQQATYFISATYEDQIGSDYVVVGCTRLGAGVQGVSGSGTLATVRFFVSDVGNSVLDLFDTKLRDSIPNPIEHTATDGYVISEAPSGVPIANYAYAPSKPLLNETIAFDASLSYDLDGMIERYIWDFNDGTTAVRSTPEVAHAFGAMGYYWVTLTVVDNEEKTSSIRKMVRVYAQPTLSPEWMPQNPVENETVVFIANAYDPDGWIVSYSWNFGDGAFGSGPSASHIYATAGTYTVTLTAIDNDGFTVTVQALLVVLPRIEVSIMPEKGIVGTLVSITGSRATPNGYVNIYWGSRAFTPYGGWFYNYTLIGTATANPNGDFGFSFNVPPSIEGVQYTRVQDVTTRAVAERAFEVIPYLSIDPTSGPAATTVRVMGTGFPYYSYGITQLLLFDDQFYSFAIVDERGNLQATINVPPASPGLHVIKALLMSYTYPTRYYTVEAAFTVIETSPIDVNLDVGAIYFKGETAEFHIQTVFKGTAIDVTSLNVQLQKPDGTTQELTPNRVAVGLYSVKCVIEGKGSMTGTYTLIVGASQATETMLASGTNIRTFVVKSTWERETPKMAALSIASIGLIGGMLLLWRKEKKRYL